MAEGKLHDLKNGPKEDKVAVASSVAIGVVVILLVAWAIFFFKKIQNGSQQLNLSGGAADQLNLTQVKQAQQDLKNFYGNDTQDLKDIRNQDAGGGANQMQTIPQQTQDNTTDQFGTTN